MKCCICEGSIIPQRNPDTGEIMWDQGHNAEPVADGRCCDECNYTVVLSARLINMAVRQGHDRKTS
jgi:hypothetical protein